MRILKLAAVLVSCCLLFASCGSRVESDSDKPGTNATGRYLEEKVNFPNLANIYALQQAAPDIYYVLGQQEGDPAGAWCSQDGGVSWRTTGHADLSGLEILSAAFTPDGNFYITFADISDPENVTFQCAFVDENNITVIQDIPELSEFNSGMVLTESGDLLIDNGFSFTQVNLETGRATQYELSEGQLFPGNYTVFGDKMAVCEGSHITVFDTSNGDTDTVKLPTEAGMGTAIAVQEDGSGFFYCNRDGLYRVTMDGAIAEQLIDGALAGFGMPSATAMKLLACQDGSFLVLSMEQGAYQVQRYVYEPDIAREPSHELTVFSLRDDVYIRQVIGLFQREYPDVMVRLQVGLPENTAVTANDAIRALSTELLADKGPDVFVLDGLPVDSYIQKGVLLDLKPSLESIMDDLLPNVANVYRSGDSLYAIPTRVSMPVLGGIGIEGIGSLHDFVAYVETQQEQRIGLPKEILMEQFYPVCAANWFKADGTLDVAALSSDLTDLERLAQISDSQQYNHAVTDIYQQSMFWSGEGLAAIFGRLDRLENTAEIFSAFDVRGGGSIKPFPASSGGCIIPSSVLGVNASGKQAEASLDFVRFALEAEIQKSSLRTGMPVNKTALEIIAGSEEPGAAMGGGSVSFNDTPEEYELVSYWPTDEQIHGIIEMLASVDTAAHHNEIIRQMVLDETAELFSGNRTVADVVEALSQKIERYLQE